MNKIVILCSVLVVSGCSYSTIGSTLGGIVGGHVGGQLGRDLGGGLTGKLVQASGVIAGAYIGSEVGRKLDQESYKRMVATSQNTLEYGVDGDAGEWKNPNNNAHGEFIVQDTQYVKELRTTCRKYKQIVYTSGKKHVETGRACRHGENKWKKQ